MVSPQSTQEAATSLPAVVEKWVLDQEVSFLVEEVIAAVGAAGLGREELARRLAAHPGIARVGEKHHTPRTVAHRASFVVRLMLEEREGRFLVPGHRLFPFCPLDGPPLDLTLHFLNRTISGVEETEVSPTTLTLATRLLDPKDQPDGGEAAFVYDWSRSPGAGPLPTELKFSCVDFQRRRYVVEPHGPVSPSDWQKARSVFVEELIFLLQSPPPGPVFAARQMLHVVASAFEKGWTLPVGPLGPLLVQDDRVDVSVVSGRTAFILAGADARSVPRDEGLDSVLNGFLRDAEGDLKLGPTMRGSVGRYSWDRTRLLLSADVTAGDYWPLRAALDLSQLSTEFRSHCTCREFHEKDLCKHGVLLLRELINHVQTPGSEIGDRVREDLSRPSWARALASLDPVLRDAAPPPAPAEVHRVTWRLKRSGGVLQVEPYVQKLQPSGSWTRGRVLRPDRLADGEEPSATEADLRAAEALEGSIHYGRRNRGDAFDALQRLIGHPHLRWEDDLDQAVRVEMGTLRLRFDVLDDGGLVPVVSAGGVELDAGDSWYAGVDGFVVFDPGAHRVVLALAARPVQQIVVILVAGRSVFPPEARAEIVARLPGLEAALPVDLPAELAGEEVPGDTRILVRLAPVASSGLVASIRLRPLAGGPLVAPGEPPERVSDITGGKRVCVKRRLADEAERAKGLGEALGLTARPTVAPMSWVLESDDDALDLVASLQDEKWKDLVVEWDDAARKMLLSREATPKDLRVAVQDAQDWFGIDGELEIDGTVVPLAQVIQALREGRRYIPVTGGVWVRISKLFQDRLREMGDLLQIDRGKLRIGPEAAPLLREAVREIGLTKACRAWEAFLDRFDRAMKIEPKPPKGFKAEFRPYQLEGYRWLSRLAAWGVGGILADDMGLGKTVQALALLLDRAKDGPALVVAPTSVSSNWIAEARRFAPKLRPVLYRETDRAAEPDEIKNGDLVVVSYAMAMRDVERLAKVKWGTLVLDEAQFVKNSQTKTAQAIRQIAAG
ncbi:MAG: SNF2-related protein, partial [Planctomycetota bacterium]